MMQAPHQKLRFEMVKNIEKEDILILGASGGVGRAVLRMFADYRSLFSSVVLLDRDSKVLHDSHLNHKAIDYTFLHVEFNKTNVSDIIKKIVSEHKISIVLDLTDYDTLPILAAADSLGLKYMNCSLNSEGGSMLNFVDDMKSFSDRFKNNSHVLSLGMNPGIANHLIIKGVLEHGAPLEIVEIEYDSGMPTVDSGKPFITWSKKQFLNEAVWGNAGYCGTNGVYKELDKKAIETLVDTREYLEPIKKLTSYPMGMIVSHDEVIAMSRLLEVPGKFVYAIHPTSLNRLMKLMKMGEEIGEDDLVFEDNTIVALDGSDCVGVWLKYQDKDICYAIDIKHSDIRGTNATLFMVAVGVIAGLVDFIENPLKDHGVYSVLDLNNENFLRVVSKHLKIEKYKK
jgi:homospermidine synthase